MGENPSSKDVLVALFGEDDFARAHNTFVAATKSGENHSQAVLNLPITKQATVLDAIFASMSAEELTSAQSECFPVWVGIGDAKVTVAMAKAMVSLATEVTQLIVWSCHLSYKYEVNARDCHDTVQLDDGVVEHRVDAVLHASIVDHAALADAVSLCERLTDPALSSMAEKCVSFSKAWRSPFLNSIVSSLRVKLTQVTNQTHALFSELAVFDRRRSLL